MDQLLDLAERAGFRSAGRPRPASGAALDIGGQPGQAVAGGSWFASIGLPGPCRPCCRSRGPRPWRVGASLRAGRWPWRSAWSGRQGDRGGAGGHGLVLSVMGHRANSVDFACAEIGALQVQRNNIRGMTPGWNFYVAVESRCAALADRVNTDPWAFPRPVRPRCPAGRALRGLVAGLIKGMVGFAMRW